MTEDRSCEIVPVEGHEGEWWCRVHDVLTEQAWPDAAGTSVDLVCPLAGEPG